MRFTVELERETDGRWIAEVQEIPGVMAYGDSEAGAMAAVQALALRVLAEQIEDRARDQLTTPIEFVTTNDNRAA